MPIKVIKQAPQSLTVLWKDVQVGDVYRAKGLMVLAVQSLKGAVPERPRAVALETTDSTSTKIGDVWSPGENSEWTPMLATMTVAVKCEN